MTFRFAYECFADEDIVLVLRDRFNISLRKRHSGNQGEVINDLLKNDRADVGMVDEDPGRSHHRLRSQMELIHTTIDIEVRRMSDRHLFILKPELEDCFLSAMRRVGLTTTLPSTAKELQRVLNLPNHPSHATFREELVQLHKAAVSRNASVFITELERVIKTLFVSKK